MAAHPSYPDTTKFLVMSLEDEKDLEPTMVAIPFDKPFNSDETTEAIRKALGKLEVDAPAVDRIELVKHEFPTCNALHRDFPGRWIIPLNIRPVDLRDRFNQRLAKSIEGCFVWRVHWKPKERRVREHDE